MKNQDKPVLSGVKEIARRANVSIATVDRVVHNRKGVSEITRQKINQIISDMGFQPNLLASRLASKKVNQFAILIPHSDETDYWEAPLKGMTRAHEEIKQYGVVIEKFLFDLNDKNSFVNATELILQHQFDGVLVAPSFIQEAVDFANLCKDRRIPYIFINSDIPGLDSLGYVGPHLHQSGYQAAQLINFGIRKGKVLIVNISKEIDSYHHLLRKEEGFRAYFKNNAANEIELIKVDIRNTDESAIASALEYAVITHKEIKAVFVTNSRVRSVADFLLKQNMEQTLLIGYDVLKENIDHLKRGTIDFLIGQKPEEQGYIGIMTLFQHVVGNATIEKENHMPIDIITKENYMFYKN